MLVLYSELNFLLYSKFYVFRAMWEYIEFHRETYKFQIQRIRFHTRNELNDGVVSSSDIRELLNVS